MDLKWKGMLCVRNQGMKIRTKRDMMMKTEKLECNLVYVKNDSEKYIGIFSNCIQCHKKVLKFVGEGDNEGRERQRESWRINSSINNEIKMSIWNLLIINLILKGCCYYKIYKENEGSGKYRLITEWVKKRASLHEIEVQCNILGEIKDVWCKKKFKRINQEFVESSYEDRLTL